MGDRLETSAFPFRIVGKDTPFGPVLSTCRHRILGARLNSRAKSHTKIILKMYLESGLDRVMKGLSGVRSSIPFQVDLRRAGG